MGSAGGSAMIAPCSIDRVQRCFGRGGEGGARDAPQAHKGGGARGRGRPCEGEVARMELRARRAPALRAASGGARGGRGGPLPRPNLTHVCR